MSFLTRTALRSIRVGVVAPRLFSTTVVAQKSATEAVKDTIKGVDRAVSDKLVDGIEVGTSAAQKVKEATGIHSTSDIKAKASELSGQASGKASEVSGEAKGKANEVAGKAKGVKEEAKGKL